MMTDWYTIVDIGRLDSPALVVYPQRVNENISRLVEMVGGDTTRLRPHIKTHKSPEATRLLLEAGIHKFKCATIAEAEMLAICGAPDVLLAYQPIGPKLQRFIAVIRNYSSTKFSCLIDNPDAAGEMDKAFSAAHLSVPVYIDLNLGMNRTGIAPGKEALDLYRSYSSARRDNAATIASATIPAGSAIPAGATPAARPGITTIGLHAYDGHIRDTDFGGRRQKCDAAFAEVEKLRDDLRAPDQHSASDPQGPLPTMASPAFDVPPIIVAGGSPTFSIHCKRQGIECSPGTFIYWDKGYSDACPEQPFTPAALVITRVISLPDSTKLCLDLGHKSIAAENELSRRVFFMNAPELKPVSQSEEHLVVDAGPRHKYKIGDILFGLPMHICPTVALYERAFTVANGLVTGEWKNQARDRFIRF